MFYGRQHNLLNRYGEVSVSQMIMDMIRFSFACLLDGVERHFQQYFCNIASINFIGRGNLYHIMLYTSSLIEIQTHKISGNKHWLHR
jgi:hypothetical protein